MTLTKLYDPANGPMRIAGLMSGSGSNLRKIIEYGRESESLPDGAPYKVEVIFSDNPKSNAEQIGKDYGIQVITRDIREFYKRRKAPMKNLEVRAEFDEQTVKLLRPFDIDVAAFAGYMRIATPALVNAFLGVNVHPADLSIKDENGKRKYTGDHAVRDAILAGEEYIKASTHRMREEVDGGELFMRSDGVRVELPDFWDPSNEEMADKIAGEHQNLLKEFGDHVIFPMTLEYLARGNFRVDERGNMYIWRMPIPDGMML